LDDIVLEQIVPFDWTTIQRHLLHQKSFARQQAQMCLGLFHRAIAPTQQPEGHSCVVNHKLHTAASRAFVSSYSNTVLLFLDWMNGK